MDRILLCPGSAVSNPPDTGGAAARQGTTAHTLCEKKLKGLDVDTPDDEMRQAVFMFVAYVKDFVADYKIDYRETTHLLIENRIVSELVPDHGGTLDVLIITPRTLHVIDFKYGLAPVSPFDNKQLLSYLALAAEKYPGRRQFMASIVQPRVFGNPQAVEYSQDEVTSHELDVLLVADDTTRHAGEHCKWCPLKDTCDVVQVKLDSVASELTEPGEWDAAKCVDILGMAAVLKNMAVDAKERLATLMKDGQKVNGWKLVHDLANRTWKDEQAVADHFTELDLDEVIFNKKVKSPTQLLKFSKAYTQFVADNCHRENKGVIAAPESSRLPEAVVTQRVFTDLPSS
jgi:hypothetical protein